MSLSKIASLVLISISLLLSACRNEGKKPFSFKRINYSELSPFDTNNQLQAVIEIPAGTNKKIEFNKKTKKFEPDQREGKDRVIDFLPYPGNYGYVPGTLSKAADGGDGDPVDILVISESQPTGTLMPVIPIAGLLLLDEGERDIKIIAIPADSTLQTITPLNYQDFMIQYDAARRMIEDWFLNYDGYGTNRLEAWKDEAFGLGEVKKSMVNK